MSAETLEERDRRMRARSGDRPRVWIDGCYDLWHFGHANALRQASLVVPNAWVVAAVHPSETIEQHKGPPVMTTEERLAVVRTCKWVDEVTVDAPYVTSLEKLREHSIDVCVHGEDISRDENGRDSFHEVKEAGMFKLIKRTDGVSTTDIVARMLLLTKSHLQREDLTEEDLKDLPQDRSNVKRFLTTSRKIVQFSNAKAPQPGQRIVYVDGQFDMFHQGHVNFFERAREHGDYLIVGVHSDLDINRRKGSNYPIMNLHERVLCVLANKFVDEVIIGAPFVVTEDMIDDLKVDVVVHGDDDVLPSARDTETPEGDKYAVPKNRGIYREVPHTPGISTSAIIRRIIENRIRYAKRQQRMALRDSFSSGLVDVPTELE